MHGRRTRSLRGDRDSGERGACRRATGTSRATMPYLLDRHEDDGHRDEHELRPEATFAAHEAELPDDDHRTDQQRGDRE